MHILFIEFLSRNEKKNANAIAIQVLNIETKNAHRLIVRNNHDHVAVAF